MNNKILLELNENNKEIKKIREKPIVLYWGNYSCYVKDGKMHYQIYQKQQREYVEKRVTEEYWRGGGMSGNYQVLKLIREVQYIDAQGNLFGEEDLIYWENVEVTKKEWLQ